MFPSPLVVTIGSSLQLRILLAAAHAASALAIFLAALPVLMQWTGAVLLVFSLVYYCRPAQSVRLRGNHEGKLEIWHDTHWQEAHLAGSSNVLANCAVLHLAVENRKRYLIVLPDSLPREDFRRLRVWLRWRGSKPDSAESVA